MYVMLCMLCYVCYVIDVNDVRGFLVGGFTNLGNKQTEVSHVASTVLLNCIVLYSEQVVFETVGK